MKNTATPATTYAVSAPVFVSATEATMTAAKIANTVNSVTWTWTPAEGDAVTGTFAGETTAPTITSVTNVNGNQIVIVFSEKVNKTFAETAENYILRNMSNNNQATLGVTGTTTLAQGQDGVTLTITMNATAIDNVADPLGVTGLGTLDAVQYRLFINPSTSTAATRVTDLAGNAIATNSYSVFQGAIGADTTAPTFESATYSTGTGVLALTFNEPVKATSADVTRAGITVGTVALTTANTVVGAGATSSIVNITLSGALKTQVDALTAPLNVAISDGAIKDMSNNGVAATTKALTFSVAPVVSSATFDEATRTVTLNFNKDMNKTSISGVTGITVSGIGAPAAFASGEAAILTDTNPRIVRG